MLAALSTSIAHGVQDPRGLPGVTIEASDVTKLNFTQRRFQSNAGRPGNTDPVRRSMNEASVYGERHKWRLPSNVQLIDYGVYGSGSGFNRNQSAL